MPRIFDDACYRDTCVIEQILNRINMALTAINKYYFRSGLPSRKTTMAPVLSSAVEEEIS